MQLGLGCLLTYSLSKQRNLGSIGIYNMQGKWFLALKERNSIAQRNALGQENVLPLALKGRNSDIAPLQGWEFMLR